MIRWISKHLTDLLKRHRLDHLSVHGLRHTFCTLLLAGGASLKDVQEVAGHARPSVTLNMYFASIPGAGERIAGRMGDLLSAQNDGPGADDCPEIAQTPPAVVDLEAVRARKLRSKGGWAMRDSNPRPHGCKPEDLPSRRSKEPRMSTACTPARSNPCGPEQGVVRFPPRAIGSMASTPG
jgi:hypothetical protein